jgi:hypothetical protein
LVIPDRALGLPVLRALSLCTCCRQYPGAANWASSSLILSSRISLPRNCSRVGLHIVLFEACSAFTRVAARTLAPSPIRDLLHRRLQPIRHLHDCSGCFRLERSPGGTCTHWKAPPSHGARRVEMWRGDVRLSMSVSAPFVWRCLSGSAVAPFPHPAHRTGQADFPHPALGQDLTLSFACDAIGSF